MRLQSTMQSLNLPSDELAAGIEFISLLKEVFREGKVQRVANLHVSYQNIRATNGVEKSWMPQGKI